MVNSLKYESSRDREMNALEHCAGSTLFDSALGTTLASPRWFTRINLLGAFAAAELYWIYAIFVAHVLTISVYVTDRSTNLPVVSGQTGDLGEIIHAAGLVASVTISLGLFVLVWWFAVTSGRSFGQEQPSYKKAQRVHEK